MQLRGIFASYIVYKLIEMLKCLIAGGSLCPLHSLQNNKRFFPSQIRPHMLYKFFDMYCNWHPLWLEVGKLVLHHVVGCTFGTRSCCVLRASVYHYFFLFLLFFSFLKPLVTLFLQRSCWACCGCGAWSCSYWLATGQ